MTWETRGPNNRLYYYRVRSTNGCKRKQYIGIGPTATAIADADRDHRAAQEASRQSWRREQQNWKEADAPTRTFLTTIDALIKATLLVAGYRQHAGGDWRKTRHDQIAN